MILSTESLDVAVCDDFSSRLAGLTKYQPIGSREAVWIPRCRYVHTFGMRQALSLIFVGQRLEVKAIVACAVPRRIYGHFWAESVIEMAHRPLEQLVDISSEIARLADLSNASKNLLIGRKKTRVQDTTQNDV